MTKTSVFFANCNMFCGIISRIAIQSIECKQVLVQACCLTHLLVCLTVCLSVQWVNCGKLDLDAIWGGEWGWLRNGSSKGRGSFGGKCYEIKVGIYKKSHFASTLTRG